MGIQIFPIKREGSVKLGTWLEKGETSPFMKVGGVRIFETHPERGVQIFSIKREGLVKWGACSKNGDVSLIFTLSNPSPCHLFFSVLCGVCVFCSFKLFLSIFFVFLRKDLVFPCLNLISRYATSASE